MKMISVKGAKMVMIYGYVRVSSKDQNEDRWSFCGPI